MWIWKKQFPIKISHLFFHYAQNQKNYEEFFTDFLKNNMPQNSRPANKLSSDKIDKKYLQNLLYKFEILCRNGYEIQKKKKQVMKFEQKKWLQPYINLNTELKPKAENEFKKNLFECVRNNISGKRVEHVQKIEDTNCENCRTC